MSIIVLCPHCGSYVEILQINCGIFRHGALKSNGEQINPHASRKFCTKLFRRGQINGCGKPFKLVTIDGTYSAIKCAYI